MVFGKDCFWPLLKFWMAPLVSLTMLEHFDLVCIAVSKAKTGQWAISAAGNLLRTLSWPSHLHRWNHLDVLVSIRWWIVSKQVAQPPLLRQGLICKGTTPRRTWYTKNIQNQFWDHGGKHLWIKFQWPRSCLSFSYEVDVGVENTLLRNKQPSAILLRFLVETKTCFGGRFDFTPSRAETPTAG